MGPNQTYKLLHSKGNHKKKRQPMEWGKKIAINNATKKGWGKNCNCNVYM